MTEDDATGAATLVLAFDAPMQSWGTASRFERRDTATEPTKSGVVGLLASAKGHARDDDHAVARLAQLRMGVRVDREGEIERDFQTIGNVPDTQGAGHRTALSDRYYLAGALFLVALEGAPSQLRDLHAALRHPHRPLYLGRKAFVPARPLVQPDPAAAILPRPVEQVLESYAWLEERGRQRADMQRALCRAEMTYLRTVVDADPENLYVELRHDHPVSFAHRTRRYAPRAVLTGHVPLTGGVLSSRPGRADPASGPEGPRTDAERQYSAPGPRVQATRPTGPDHDPFAALEQ